MGRIGKVINADELRNAYEEIGNIKELAKIFHTSNNRMAKLLVENGIETKKVGNKIDLSAKEIKSIIKDYTIHNLTMKEICEKYNLKIDKVREVFSNNGVIAYKWHGHIKRGKTSKIGIIKKIGSVLTSNGVDFEYNFSVSKNLTVGIMANGVCIDAYKNKCLGESIEEENRTLLLRRNEKCLESGYKYVQIFEDEYKDNQDIVLSKIKHILGLDDHTCKIPARKCAIQEVLKEDAEQFLNKNHIQGFVSSSVYLGAIYEGKIVAVMCFLNENNGNWNLTRFASLNGYICQGVASKMFKYFIRNYDPRYVRSFADRRWTVDSRSNLYIKLGFELDETLKPEYRYYNPQVDKYKRFHKFGFRKSILHNKYGLPMHMTETEMATALGYVRIWDCGLFKYVWRKENEDENLTIVQEG